MHNPAAFLENDTQMPMGLSHINGSPNLGQKTRPYSNQQKKVNLQNYRLCCTGWPHNKTERKWKEGLVPRPFQGIKKKAMEHEGDDYTNRDWCIRYSN